MNAIINFLPNWLHILLISAIPVVELRGSIPIAIISLDMGYLNTYIISVLGSMIPAPFILRYAPYLLDYFSSIKLFSPIAKKIRQRGIRKSRKIMKYSFLGLFLLVAIPLPGTGVWTGCIAASIIGMDMKKALLSTFFGTMMAGLIMLILTIQTSVFVNF